MRPQIPRTVNQWELYKWPIPARPGSAFCTPCPGKSSPPNIFKIEDFPWPCRPTSAINLQMYTNVPSCDVHTASELDIVRKNQAPWAVDSPWCMYNSPFSWRATWLGEMESRILQENYSPDSNQIDIPIYRTCFIVSVEALRMKNSPCCDLTENSMSGPWPKGQASKQGRLRALLCLASILNVSTGWVRAHKSEAFCCVSALLRGHLWSL